jgi:hypothetical protein
MWIYALKSFYSSLGKDLHYEAGGYYQITSCQGAKHLEEQGLAFIIGPDKKSVQAHQKKARKKSGVRDSGTDRRVSGGADGDG